MNKYLTIAGGVLLVAVVAWVLLSNNAGTQKQVQASPYPTIQTQASPSAQPNIGSATVTLTQSGFDPQTLTVKVGTKVTWTNKSGATATVNSAVHPIHALFPFLNLGSFDDGSSVEVVFDKTGTYTYHNHLNPSQTGTVVVE